MGQANRIGFAFTVILAQAGIQGSGGEGDFGCLTQLPLWIPVFTGPPGANLKTGKIKLEPSSPFSRGERPLTPLVKLM